MGLLYKAVVVAIIAVALKRYFTKPVEYPTFGTVARGLEKVQETFRSNFKDGLEVEGSSFAVFKDGKLVVDLWGGYADREYARLWQQDTMSLFYSSSKALGAIAMAMLVDRGHMKYEDLVSKHWPEFGKHGKANVTVAMVVSHQAGVYRTKDPITDENLHDYAEIGRLLEETEPYWPPGTAAGYHGVTIGYLEDQICSRVDPQHRNLSRFLDEEIYRPHSIQFGFGFNLSDNHRMARLVPVGLLQSARANVRNPSILKNTVKGMIHMMSPGSLIGGLMESFPAFSRGMGSFANPDKASAFVPAANGAGTARDFAKIMSLFADGNLISSKLMKQINKPLRENTNDLVLGLPVSWGYGFWMSKNNQGDWIMGSPGAGGQMVKTDPHNKLALAYLTNGLGNALVEDRYMKLEKALYESIM